MLLICTWPASPIQRRWRSTIIIKTTTLSFGCRIFKRLNKPNSFLLLLLLLIITIIINRPLIMTNTNFIHLLLLPFGITNIRILTLNYYLSLYVCVYTYNPFLVFSLNDFPTMLFGVVLSSLILMEWYIRTVDFWNAKCVLHCITSFFVHKKFNI